MVQSTECRYAEGRQLLGYLIAVLITVSLCRVQAVVKKCWLPAERSIWTTSFKHILLYRQRTLLISFPRLNICLVCARLLSSAKFLFVRLNLCLLHLLNSTLNLSDWMKLIPLEWPFYVCYPLKNNYSSRMWAWCESLFFF